MSKRIVDCSLAALGLALVWPLLAVVAALIKLDSRGPVFFRQSRIGKDGRPFRILKFRTMVDNTYQIGPKLTQKRDPRITRVGQVLRHLKLDELPQLINVLKGDMSLVGPRPEDPHFVALYTPAQRAVLSVRPGIVGPSQILGRNELERYPDDCTDTERYYIEHILPEKLATDLEYVRSCGLLGDLSLLLGGVTATLVGTFRAKFFRLNTRRLALLAADTLVSVIVYNVAFGLKWDWTYDLVTWHYVAVVSLLITLIRPPLFMYFGLYQTLLRYLGVKDFLAIFKAVTLGTVAVTAIAQFLGFGSHSRLVLALDWGLLILVLSGSRIALKSWQESTSGASPAAAKRVLVVGADDTGERLVSTMASEETVPYRAIGFLDDDPTKHGVTIHGVKVLGRVSDLPVIAVLEQVDVVVLLFPHTSPASLREVVSYCRAHGLEYRLVPTLDRMMKGDVIIPELNEPWMRELATVKPVRNGAHAHNEPNGRVKPESAGEHHGHGEPSAVPNGREPHAAPAIHGGERAGDRPILVTGGAGYIGSHVVRKLLDRGRRVRVVDNLLYGRHGLADVADHPRLELIEGDIRHLRTMAIATKGVDSVIALAALVGDAACELDPEETLATNLEATHLLADACQRAQVRRLVFASSCSVYGANSELVLNEGSWLNPVSLYAQTRIGSEADLLRRKDRLSITILRLSTVFGLSTRMRLDLVVNTFAAAAFFDRRIRVFGGQQWRPNLHCQDAAEAFILAAGADDAKVRGEIFNVGDSGLNHTVLDIARIVQRESPGAEVDVTVDSPDKRDYRVSFDKIRHVLGFRTRFTVQDGAREILAAFQRGDIGDPKHERYHNFRHLKAHGFHRVAGVSVNALDA